MKRLILFLLLSLSVLTGSGQVLINSYSQNSFNLDAYFDVLNLQSNSADNFTTVSGGISQWNDLSGSGRHATQATSTARPTLVGLDPTFDGSGDYLQLASEFTSSTYTAYFIFKFATVPTITRVIAGGATVNNYIALGQSNNKTLQVNNAGTTGGSARTWSFYGEEYYCVLSIRRSGGIETIRVNNRFLRSSSSANLVAQTWGRIGWGTAGGTFNGVLKAVCISSQSFSDEVDTEVTKALFLRYGLPENSDAIAGFGDSITAGTGATTPLTGGWLPLLASLEGKPRKNFGIGGSRLTTFDSNSGVTRYLSQLVERPYSDYVCILYGTNDITAGVSTTTFQAALETVLNGLINAGYTKSKIIVGTVPYRLGDGSAALVAEYNTAITNVCSTLGLPAPADVYNSMKSGGGDSLLSDSLHPNDAGHAVIRDAFAARIP